MDAALLANRPTDKILAAIETAKYRLAEKERVDRETAEAQQAEAGAKIDAATQALTTAIEARIQSVVQEMKVPPHAVTYVRNQ